MYGRPVRGGTLPVRLISYGALSVISRRLYRLSSSLSRIALELRDLLQQTWGRVDA